MSSLGFVARLTATVTITQMTPDHRARHISIARGLARGESAIRAILLGSSSTNVNITMEESVPASKPRKPPAEVALFSFFIAPLFPTVLLGMLWKRATSAGGFLGLLAGTRSSIVMFTLVELDPSKVALIALSPLAKPLAIDMWRALWSGVICVSVTVAVWLATKPKEDIQLKGLVYGATKIPSEGHLPLVKRPIFWAGVSGVAFLILQWIFW